MPEASESSAEKHQPVLLDAVLAHLTEHDSTLDSDAVIVDGTVGLGGHAAAILTRFPKARLIGIDRDPRSLELAGQRLDRIGGSRGRVTLKQGSYADLPELVPDIRRRPPRAILLDLGYSSWQLDARGFSFQTDAPLDLRFDPSQGMTAAELIRRTPERELADLIYRYGEERASRRIAKALKEAPPETTAQLAETVAQVKPRRGKIHPVTQTFQALRIAVNDELGELERGLPALEGALATHGRLLVISFHSLEDRIVKRFIKASDGLKAVNKKVIVATREEVVGNPRARSAKLRVAEKAAADSR
ncbi:MAG: 16S rRNA (cytosine(1402)-N(4))-methyltransferase RsmH [Patescibacteria group bacterium]|nr:16S rRNA (cytosine(1402)-N(4))-methyltransferase RsmH [Patescibacteria group bacterium]